jgi:hypothetical protein
MRRVAFLLSDQSYRFASLMLTNRTACGLQYGLCLLPELPETYVFPKIEPMKLFVPFNKVSGPRNCNRVTCKDLGVETESGPVLGHA